MLFEDVQPSIIKEILLDIFYKIKIIISRIQIKILLEKIQIYNL